jgi:hypothetical protein
VKIEVLQEKIKQGRYIISFTHTEKLRQRRIKAENIEQAIENGMIIEDYPEDRRGPSCLIFGFAGKRPMNQVCGRLDADEVIIITPYEPDTAEWENDWKTRNRR